MKRSGLLKAAMLGTNRTAVLGDVPHQGLQAAWQALSEADDPAQSLLQAAAIEHICHQSGVTAITAEQPDVCDSETKPYITAAAASAFVDLTQGRFSNLAHEWISVVQSHALLATPRLLPSLLVMGDLDTSLRAAISDIAGKRGQWLAAREKRWSWLDAATDETLSDDLWATGTPAERRQWLQLQLIKNPDYAAECVATSWPGDSPDTREAFTELVALNPHPAHEAWLQQYAIIDRRQNIRLHAVRALMSIEHSAYRQRSLERAAALLSIPKKLVAKNKLQCQPPKKFDPAWKSDGIREKPPSGTGPRDYWLLQILSVIPLCDWPALTGHDNPLTLTVESDWAATVEKAWQQSAITFPDSQSVMPLLKRLASNKGDAGSLSAMANIIATIGSDDVADVLEHLKLSSVQSLELIRQLLPPLNLDKHPGLHKVATAWVTSKNDLTKADAVALAGCCDRHAIPALLEKISKAKELSSAAEEFTRALEYRQSYLKHFTLAD